MANLAFFNILEKGEARTVCANLLFGTAEVFQLQILLSLQVSSHELSHAIFNAGQKKLGHFLLTRFNLTKNLLHATLLV